MKHLYPYLFLCLTALLFSCEDESETTFLDQDEQKSGILPFLSECTPDDKASPYFVSGDFDGVPIHLATTHGNLYPSHDTTFNAQYYDTSIGLDNVYLIRRNNENSIQIAFYFINTRMPAKALPYVLPHTNLDYCENVQIELLDLKKVGTAPQGSLQDNFSYWGYSGNNSIQVTVTDFTDNTVTGTFEGYLKSNTGTTIRVKNGRFRIKTVVVNRNSTTTSTAYQQLYNTFQKLQPAIL
ncbi:hypothetical protein C1N53_14995 [Pontibacter sp. SGAir0037]|nr:hypothetical protein C1N53_14995 [Pontibacter sp. SGAir0037]